MKLSRNLEGKDDSDDGLDSRENINNLAKILLSAAIISVTFNRNIYSSVTDHKLSRIRLSCGIFVVQDHAD